MREALDRGLTELEAAALVVVATSSSDPDLAGFVGPVHLGESLLAFPRGGRPALLYYTPMEREQAAATGLALLSPEDLGLDQLMAHGLSREQILASAIEAVLARLGIEPTEDDGRIALAGTYPAGVLAATARQLEHHGWSLVAGNRLCRLARKTKSAAETLEARRVAAGTATALRHVAALLTAASERDGELWLREERLTVGTLKREVARTLADLELEQPEGNLIAPAEEGAVPHNTGSRERVLRAGESLVVDLFPKGGLYADCTRTFCVGRPPEALTRAHAAVLDALDRAYHRLTPEALAQNRRAFSLQDAVCAHFQRLGYPTQVSHPGTTVGYVHNLGHGVGYELHEYPSFRREIMEEGLLTAGDLLTLEPGLYDPAAGWAVRLEDLVLLGEGGAENLTPLPYALDPREWL